MPESMTLEQLKAKFHAEQAQKRAEAHAQVDALFDRIAAEQLLQWVVMERELDGEKVH